MIFDKFLEDLEEDPSFRVRRVRKKKRTFYEPNESMKILHGRFIEYLRDCKIDLPYSTGGEIGDSIFKNVNHHRGNRYFYILDIFNFFPSVDGRRLANLLCSICEDFHGREDELFDFLKKYFLAPKGGLPIGAPASPILANIFAGLLIDKPIVELIKEKGYGLKYTRYFDDITFSSKRAAIGIKKRRALREVIEISGLLINHKKTKICDLKNQSVVITGVGLRPNGSIYLPTESLTRLRGIIHLGMKGRVSPETVIGSMSVFKHVVRGGRLNETERKVWNKFRLFLGKVKPYDPSF